MLIVTAKVVDVLDVENNENSLENFYFSPYRTKCIFETNKMILNDDIEFSVN